MPQKTSEKKEKGENNINSRKRNFFSPSKLFNITCIKSFIVYNVFMFSDANRKLRYWVPSDVEILAHPNFCINNPFVPTSSSIIRTLWRYCSPAFFSSLIEAPLLPPPKKKRMKTLPSAPLMCLHNMTYHWFSLRRKEDESVESRSFHKFFTFLITNAFHLGCDIYSASTMHSGDVLINIFLHPVPVPSLFDFSLEWACSCSDDGRVRCHSRKRAIRTFFISRHQ